MVWLRRERLSERPVQVVPLHRFDVDHAAQPPRPNNRPALFPRRVEQVVVTDAHQPSVFRGSRQDPVALGHVHRERLLDQRRPTRLDREQGGVVVQRVDGGDVDGINGVVGHQLLVRAVGPRNPVLGREPLC